ncbi:MAG: heme o synthase [Ilumatobacteraceae bacterium]
MAVGARPLVPSRLAPGGIVHGSRRTPTTVLGGYVALTKPRIIELLLITTVPTMILAQGGWPATRLVLITLLGGTLAAGGANTYNMVVDRDIDTLMPRTQGRPLVTGLIKPRQALVFATALEVAAFAVLWSGANLLAAILALCATLFYVFVYTLWLKRTSTQNIVIGGAAGAVPVLVGWAAVRDSVGWAPVVLFAVMFLWTPPHFWALAIRYADDYRAADVPMLPAVATPEVTAHKMAGYTAVMVVATLVLVPVAHLGWVYAGAAVVLGLLFLLGTIDLGRNPTPQRSMRVFGYSITYVTLLFGAMTLDVFLRR